MNLMLAGAIDMTHPLSMRSEPLTDETYLSPQKQEWRKQNFWKRHYWSSSKDSKHKYTDPRECDIPISEQFVYEGGQKNQMQDLARPECHRCQESDSQEGETVSNVEAEKVGKSHRDKDYDSGGSCGCRV
jgi:hypothetical protein